MEIYFPERRISAILANDPIYQQLECECVIAEEAYQRTMDTLPQSKRQVIERYLSACEEIDHRKLTLALELLPNP